MNYAVSARRALLGFKAAFTGGGKNQEQKKALLWRAIHQI